MAKTKTAKDQKTLVTFLLDETGSMKDILEPTIEGFNSYLGTLKSSGTPIDFTLIKFDTTKVEKVCVAIPVAQVAELNKQTYVPGMGTPLIDAAVKTIKAVEKSVAENGGKAKIVICIQTDGDENASTQHTWDELNALIKAKTALGWQFNFLGTGIDAYKTGTRMGIPTANTMSSGLSPQNVRASYAGVAASSVRFASGASQNTSFLATMRRRHAPKPTKQPIVDDFSL